MKSILLKRGRLAHQLLIVVLCLTMALPIEALASQPIGDDPPNDSEPSRDCEEERCCSPMREPAGDKGMGDAGNDQNKPPHPDKGGGRGSSGRNETCPTDDPPNDPPLPDPPLLQPEEDDDCSPPPDETNFPIYLQYGSVIETAEDLVQPTSTLPWVLKRTYNSNQLNVNGPFGPGWSSFQASAVLSKTGSFGPGPFAGKPRGFRMTGSSVSQIRFEAGIAGTYRAPPGSSFTISPNSAVQYSSSTSITVRRRNEAWTFSPSSSGFHKLESYWGVGQGPAATYTTDNLGRVKQITTASPQNYSIYYDYAGTSRVQSVEIRKPIAGGSFQAIQRSTYTYKTSAHDSDTAPYTALIQVRTSRLVTGGNPAMAGDWIHRYQQYRYDDQVRMTHLFDHGAIYRAIADNSNISSPEDLLTRSSSSSGGSAGGHDLQHFATKRFEYYESPEDTSGTSTAFSSNEDLERYGGSDIDETGRVKREIIGPGSCSSCAIGTAAGVAKSYYYMEINGGDADSWNVATQLVVEDTTDTDDNPVTRKVWALNEDGRILRDATITDPTSGGALYWCTSRTFTDDEENPGRVAEMRRPSAHNESVTSDPLVRKFLNPYNGSSWANDQATLDDSGQITIYQYEDNPRRIGRLMKDGKNGTAYYTSFTEYGDGASLNSPTTRPRKRWRFDEKVAFTSDFDPSSLGASEPPRYEYAYTFYFGMRAMQTRKITLPAIPVSENGSGEPTVLWEGYDRDGRLRWTRDGEGYTSYYSYHPKTGGLALEITDVDTTNLPSAVTQGTDNWMRWEGSSLGSAGAVPADLVRDPSNPSPLGLTRTWEFEEDGRLRMWTGPGGEQHFKLYDLNRTMRFRYLDSTTGSPNSGKPILPVLVAEYDDAMQQVATYEVDPTKTTLSPQGKPSGLATGTSQGDYFHWMTAQLDGLTGRVTSLRRYHNIPDNGDGSEGTSPADNYYSTHFLYDALGRSATASQYVEDGKYQVNVRLYDVHGRPFESRVGVRPAPPTDYASLANATPASGYTTAYETVYDNGGVGDDHVTETKRYYGVGATLYTQYTYSRTYRNHLRSVVRSDGAGVANSGPHLVQDVDWLGRPIAQALFATPPATPPTGYAGDANGHFVHNPATGKPTAAGHFNARLIEYDDWDQIYRTRVFPGFESDHWLQTDSYYNRRGEFVSTGDPHAAAVEYAYDGARRLYQARVVANRAGTAYQGGAFTYNDPAPHPDFDQMTTTGAGEQSIIELSHSKLNDVGNTVAQHTVEIDHDSSILSLNNGQPTNGVRITTLTEYDAADRMIRSAYYGAGSQGAGTSNWESTPFSFNGPVPAASDSKALVTQYDYDDANRRRTVTDPKDVSSRTFYDDLDPRHKRC